MAIADQIVGHFDQLFAELEIAIAAFPDELWRRRDGDDLLRTPAFQAHHAIWCMALDHLLKIPFDRFPDTALSGRNYAPANIPTQDDVLAMLRGIRDNTSRVYGAMTDEEYLAEGEGDRVPLGAAVDALGHGRHHGGKLCQTLKDNGIEPPDWYPLR